MSKLTGSYFNNQAAYRMDQLAQFFGITVKELFTLVKDNNTNFILGKDYFRLSASEVWKYKAALKKKIELPKLVILFSSSGVTKLIKLTGGA